MNMADRPLAQLSPQEKRTLIADLVRNRALQPKLLPLSHAQERMWFLQEFAQTSPLYNIPMMFRLDGDLNTIALERAISEIVTRHEALRTTFVRVADKPMQVVNPPTAVRLPVCSLTHLDGETQSQELSRIASGQGGQLFNLAEGPLVHNLLVRLAPTKHVLFRTLHHIVSDGWSAGVFNRELKLLYDAFSNGLESPLPDVRVQYSDYALWQREWLRGETLVQQLNHWKAQLEGAPEALELATDHPRPGAVSFRGAIEEYEFPTRVTEALRGFSQREGVTLFMTLLAAFQVLLHRYTGQDEIVVGTQTANRNRKEIEGMIGCVTNTLALRGDISGDPVVREVLKRTREVTLAAYTNQDLPFALLVEALQPKRDLSRSPIFQAMFVFENAHGDDLELPGLIVTPLQNHNGTSKFDLTLAIVDSTKGLEAVLEYNTDIFEPATAKSMLRHFRFLLEGMLESPCGSVLELPLEEKRLQAQPPLTRAHQQCPQVCVHRLFEEQVKKTPEATAVIFEKRSLSYGELNCRANLLAHRLRLCGIGPESRVGIFLERSFDMIVGLLATMKAGGAYVPLDPHNFGQRLEYMLTDAAVSLILTQEKLKEKLGVQTAKVVTVDGEEGEAAGSTSDCIGDVTQPQNALYVIYTSGSTGLPKGVVVAHASVVNCIWDMQRRIGFGSGDVLLAMTTICFDISTLEIFLPLVSGGQVVLESGDLPACEEIWKLIDESGVTAMQATPSLWRILQGSERAVRKRNLKVLCGGEALRRDLALKLSALGSSVINLYGPTETTIWSTIYHLQENVDISVIPIGGPIANTDLYVMDPYAKPVPAGVPGELYIGGAGLARGYWERPELTAEKFVPDAWSGNSGARLYRTGDRARLLPTGDLEFLGRVDHQVKLRGYRIELGEIESVLEEHVAVAQAIVVVREDVSGDARLVAYVVQKWGMDLIISELRDFLKERLPAYMVPSSFVWLPRLPLSRNGKVDRKQLPSPDPAETRERQYVPPQTTVEQKLAKIWEKVLRVDQVGSLDNFFQLGGHSLLATQMIARARDEFRLDVPMRAFFREPTIAGLGKIIAGKEGFKPPEASPIMPVSRDIPLPLSPGEMLLWSTAQLSPSHLGFNTALGTRFKGALDVEALQRSVNEIIRRHEVLHTTYAGSTSKNGEPFRLIVPPSSIPFPIIDMREVPPNEREDQARSLSETEAHAPFDLAKGPLLRAKLLKLDHEDHVFLLVFHHIVVDGWSLGVFARELRILYEFYSGGKPGELPPLSVQYADYVMWQRNQMQSLAMMWQVAYWKNRLKSLPGLLPLPLDSVRPAPLILPSDHLRFSIGKNQIEALKSLSRQEGVTQFVTLLAILLLLLHRITGVNDLVVQTLVAGRGRSELEGLIGLFANSIILRIDVSGNPSFRQLLQRLQKISEDAYSNQDLPLLSVMEILGQEELVRLRGAPFQFSFNFINVPDFDLELPGLNAQVLDGLGIEPAVAQDISLNVVENNDGAHFRLVYKRGLFSRSRMEGIAEQYKDLVSQVLETTEKRVSQFSLVTPLQKMRLPDPAESLDMGWEVPVHIKFADHARRFPERIAVTDGSNSWTYGQLLERSDQIACSLNRNGIRPGDAVAIEGRPGALLICGLLGILRTGAAIVILDRPSNTDLKHLNLRGLIRVEDTTGTSLAHRDFDTPHCHYCLILSPAVFCDEPMSPVGHNGPEAVPVRPEDCACIDFASSKGETSSPIYWSHQYLSLFPRWGKLALDLQTTDRFGLSPRPLSACLLQQIFMVLWTGAQLCIIPRKHLRENDLTQWMYDQQISILFLHPVMARSLTPANSDRLPSLRYAMFCGDYVTPHDVWRLQKIAPSARCINLHVASDGLDSLGFLAANHGPAGSVIVPIGRGIAGIQLLVLNRECRQAGVGELGDIWIRIPSVHKHYRSSLAEDQEKFILNPYTNDPADWLLRTNDWGHYLPDGTIELIGARSRSFVSQGSTIQAEQIEATLLSHSALRQVLVEFEKAKDGKTGLVAYVVLSDADSRAVPRLQKTLRESVRHSISASIVTVNTLPFGKEANPVTV
jgi:amino acid adenylation domain-containing protein